MTTEPTRAVLLRIREWLAGRTSESPSAMARELDAVLAPPPAVDEGPPCAICKHPRSWHQDDEEEPTGDLECSPPDCSICPCFHFVAPPFVAPPPPGGEPQPAPGRARLDELLARIRGGEWSVAVHNDYRLDGIAHTFWLFTHPDGRWVKGEGRSDVEALEGSLCRLFPAAPPPSALATGGRIPSHRTSSECVSAGDIGDTHGEHGHSCGICGGDVPCAEVEACAPPTAEVPGVDGSGGYEAYEDPHTREMLYRPRAPTAEGPPKRVILTLNADNYCRVSELHAARAERDKYKAWHEAATIERAEAMYERDAARADHRSALTQLQEAAEMRTRHASELAALRAAHEETVRREMKLRQALYDVRLNANHMMDCRAGSCAGHCPNEIARRALGDAVKGGG